jgi:hypothetical protein
VCSGNSLWALASSRFNSTMQLSNLPWQQQHQHRSCSTLQGKGETSIKAEHSEPRTRRAVEQQPSRRRPEPLEQVRPQRGQNDHLL